MFILSVLEDSIRVEPKDLARPRGAAISGVIEQLLVDKVVADLGLVVTLYDIQGVESGFVHPNDGGARFRVRFRVVVFRPFPGEVLVAKVKNSTKDGIYASMGFFDDIFIPQHYLPEPSFFNEADGTWFWRYTDGEGSVNDMDIDPDKDIRLKVQSIDFRPTPTPNELKKLREKDPLIGTSDKPFAPMLVTGRINDEGLGLLSWWREEESDSEESSDDSDEQEKGSGDVPTADEIQKMDASQKADGQEADDDNNEVDSAEDNSDSGDSE